MSRRNEELTYIDLFSIFCGICTLLMTSVWCLITRSYTIFASPIAASSAVPCTDWQQLISRRDCHVTDHYWSSDGRAPAHWAWPARAGWGVETGRVCGDPSRLPASGARSHDGCHCGLTYTGRCACYEWLGGPPPRCRIFTAWLYTSTV